MNRATNQQDNSDELNKNKALCYYPFKAIDVISNSKIIPCCRFDERLNQTTDPVTSNNTITDIFHNSDYYNNMRNKMLKGEKIKGCWKCYKEEESNMPSMRLRSHQSMNQNIEINLEYMEVEVGRFCNLKCRSCSPDVSSGFHNEMKSDKSMEKFWNWDLSDKMFDVDNQLNEVFLHIKKEQVESLRYLKVTGGEPLLSQYFVDFLNKLVEWDLAKNISIELYTNCTFLPKQKLLDNFKYFKFIELYMSIDDINERSDFLRSGSEWKVMEKVAKSWANFTSKNDNMRLSVSTTISIFNIFYLKQLVDWIASTLNIDWPNINFAYWPKYMYIGNFGKEIQQEIDNMLKKDFDKNTLSEAGIYNISKIESIVKDQNPGNNYEDFINYTSLFDTARNENWKETFPKLHQLLKQYKNSI